MFKFLKSRSNIASEVSAEHVSLVSEFFDDDFYLRHYPTVSRLGIDPVAHYLTLGWRRGYDPCAWFSTSGYLADYRDVRENGVCPLVHYAMFGRQEDRPLRCSDRIADDAGADDDRQGDVLTRVYREFDSGYYREQSPDLANRSALELFNHFMNHGWKEHRDPNRWFETRYYLAQNPDIAASGQNPFIHYVRHGRAEKRPTRPYRASKNDRYEAQVTAIVPNFEHAPYLKQRLESIVEQSHPPAEIIVLDDASSDNSVEIIQAFADGSPVPVRTVFNETNSGNVFRQWRKGFELARHELIWICESDDFCDPDFLKTLAPYFADPSIMLGFGRIEFSRQDGETYDGMAQYRESAAEGIWEVPRIMGATQWFAGPLGLRNVISNVGGCLIRNQPLAESVWDNATRYRVCGDWYLYMQLVAGGRIAYDPDAVAYFRQHQSNTSVSSFKDDPYYVEHYWIACELRRQFGISDDHLCRFYGLVRDQFEIHRKDDALEKFHRCFPLQPLIDQEADRFHVLMGILGFSTGGGEIFPINLANELVRQGVTVSVLVLDPDLEIAEVRRLLHASVAVYERPMVDELGVGRFFAEGDFDVLHTHFLGLDLWLTSKSPGPDLPYVVTHHGSYDLEPIEPANMLAILATVSQWVYIADKNLQCFSDWELEPGCLTKLPNAVADKQGSFAISRKDLNIDEDDFVFGLASRALWSKGWDVAIAALEKVRQQTDKTVHLVLCGAGDDFDEIHQQHQAAENVHFLGFQSNIPAFYELCDVCVLPTRFPGESYPLTIIESYMGGAPVIATDIGEISGMLDIDGEPAGILLAPTDDDQEFIERTAAAMQQVLVPGALEKLAAAVAVAQSRYSMSSLAERYLEVYRKAVTEFKARRTGAQESNS